jgi:hypothetical protein
LGGSFDATGTTERMNFQRLPSASTEMFALSGFSGVASAVMATLSLVSEAQAEAATMAARAANALACLWLLVVG